MHTNTCLAHASSFRCTTDAANTRTSSTRTAQAFPHPNPPHTSDRPSHLPTLMSAAGCHTRGRVASRARRLSRNDRGPRCSARGSHVRCHPPTAVQSEVHSRCVWHRQAQGPKWCHPPNGHFLRFSAFFFHTQQPMITRQLLTST
jgi:hypothetical protein